MKKHSINSQIRKPIIYTVALSSIALAIATIVACSNQPQSSEEPITIAASSPSGAQLWADNCARCHNFRDPSSYSDAQWEIAGLHMRTRANLTGKDYRSILEFLKSSNQSD